MGDGAAFLAKSSYPSPLIDRARGTRDQTKGDLIVQTRSLALALALAALAAAPSASAKQILSTGVESAETTSARCQDGIRRGDGIVSRRVRMPADGLVQARLRAPRGDWDVAVFDAASGAVVAASSGFNSNELADGFAAAGRTLVVQACRVSGTSRTARVSVTSHALRRSTGRRERAQLVRVDTPTRADKNRLNRLGLDVTEHAGRDYVEVVLYGAQDVAKLRRGGFGWDVEIADLDRLARANARRNAQFARSVRSSQLPSGRDSYRRLADYESDMKKLAADHPGLVRAFTLPHKTVEGRDVYGIEVSENVSDQSDGKPVFLMMGLHHAREWPSGEHAIEFATDLVNSYVNGDARVAGLLGRTRVVFVPVVNPDGFTTSREAALDFGNEVQEIDDTGYAVVSLTDPFVAYKRRNCRIVGSLPSAPGLCALPLFRLTGVDLNRNYGALWGGPGASALPLYDTYRGPGPFSEPETQNVRELVSGRQVTTLITNHTFSNLVLRPPGVAAQGLPPDEEAMKDLGDRMAAQNGYTSQPAYGLYDTTGTTEDWSYNATGGYGYTFEIGPEQFHPAFENVVAEYRGAGAYAGRGNREAYLLALENAANPQQHSVISGRAPAGTVLRLHKTFITNTSPVRLTETDIANDPTGVELDPIGLEDKLESTLVVGSGHAFEWHVNPSTRPAVQDRRFREPRDIRSETFTSAGEQSVPAVSHHDREFTVTAEDNADQLVVGLEWATPDDYDLEVYRREADGSLTRVGGSGNPPGEKESATIEAPGLVPGTYVLRVVNFAAVGQDWTMTATLRDADTIRTEPGSGPESWTLSCERPDGTVVAQQQIVVARGQSVDLGQACAPALLAPVGARQQRSRAVRISRRAVRVGRNRVVPIRLYCPRANAPGRCSGVLQLAVSRRVGARTRGVKLGRRPYSLAAGRSATVRVRVSRRALRVLRRSRTVRLRITAVPSVEDAGVARRAVRLRLRR